MFKTKDLLFTSSDIKREAKAQLAGRWPSIIFMFVVPMFVMPVLTLCLRILLEEPFAYPIWGTYWTWLLDLVFIFLNLLNYHLQYGPALSLVRVIRRPQDRIEPLSDLFYLFREGRFGPYLILGIVKSIFIFLWSLLFIIPGIIKQLAYSQAEYIKNDYRARGWHLTTTETITLSRQMMDGHKMDLFALYLSFIGWFILVALTFGLLSFYVIPYLQMSLAVFYQNISKDFFAEVDEKIKQEELDF